MHLAAEDTGAFCPHGRFRVTGSAAGILHGLTFAVKDFIDIAGHVTGAGNPRWLETHGPAPVNASCVQRLLDAGASVIGKTITDELAYSINGDNFHYGTPLNPAAPERVPGGSSSGSASAVAADLCDFALGTDTGGSVRIPASYCGVYGIRTTHGNLPMDGIVPFMPSLDTIGWFARDAPLFRSVGDVLLPQTGAHLTSLTRLIFLFEVAAECGPEVLEALRPALTAVVGLFGDPMTVSLAKNGLETWRQAFRRLSASEVWSVHGEWIESANPVFGPAIAERFAFARQISGTDVSADIGLRQQIRDDMHRLLGSDGILCIPTAPGPAPLKSAGGEIVEQFRQRAQRLTCIAGLAGLPQVSIPAATIDHAPLGLSLVGPAGSDRLLLDACVALSARWPSAETVHRNELVHH